MGGGRRWWPHGDLRKRRFLRRRAAGPRRDEGQTLLDLIAYGGGRSVLAALGHINTIGRRVESIHYVGDLDHAGLDIAWGARRCAKELKLPAVLPASELHRQMLLAADSFGHPQGWPAQERLADRARIFDFLSEDVRGRVDAILSARRRIPEEVLGPNELRSAWSVP